MLNNKVNIYYAGFVHRVGGAYFHVVNLSKGLKENGFDVTIVTLDDLPIFIRYIPHVFQKLGNFLNFPMGFVYKQNLIKYFFKYRYQNNSDIEIFEDIYTYWKSSKKSVVVLHAIWSDNLQTHDISEAQRLKLEARESEIINNIDSSVVTVSQPYKKFIVSRLQKHGLVKNLEVVELGVDIDKFKAKKNINNSIVFVGSLEARKNIKFLLQVFKKLRLLGDYTLTLVGDGPDEIALKNFVAKLNLQKVSFLGRLSYDEVMKELVNHQYYLHTSTKESFSYSLLEAKLSGLTTIAFSGLEVPPEFIDIKMESFDLDEWVDKIFESRVRSSEFKYEKFSYKNMTKQTLDILD